MRRRDLLVLGGSSALLPLGAAAQPSPPVIGFLFVGDPQRSAWWTDAWSKTIGEAGFVEGQNFATAYRWGEGDPGKLPGFAADLVSRRVAVIVTTSEQATVAAKQATTTIPIVFGNIFDPVGKRFVQSIAKPGGNITGIAAWEDGALEAKRLQLLHQVIPSASRVGYLVAEQDVASRLRAIDAVAAAGKTLGIEVVLLTAETVAGIDSAIGTARQRGIGAVLVQAPSTLLYAQQNHVLAAGVAHGMALASGNVDFAAGGGLMEYGGLPTESPSLIATYVSRILKGEKVAELPVQQAAKFQLILNLKTAKAIGIAFPKAILGTADEVIE